MMRSLLFAGLSACASLALAQSPSPNYGEALQKSILFYEAQQAGPKPSWNRVYWRGDSVVNDGAEVGVNLSGGWFDAGDHVKFGFPMAFSASMLAWGAVDFRSGYVSSGQLDEIQRNLRFVNDYFRAAHPSPNVFYGQVGVGDLDHAFWGPAEVVEQRIGASRVAYKIDLNCKGPDLAAETAAAMASASLVFRGTDAAYANTLLAHARQLYALAVATVGVDGKENNYANCITDARSFYNAGFGLYWDEMAWGALWLYRATGEAQYLTRFNEYYPRMGNDGAVPTFGWSLGWNDKAYGVYVLAAKVLGDARYHTDAQRYLDYWVRPTAQGGGRKTPAGLIVVDPQGWGTLRYAANTAFLALAYADVLGSSHPKYASYFNFGKRQIDYMLGDNPRASSYVVGFGNNPPLNVHHRGSHGSWSDSIEEPAQQRHVLYGALVGGPASADDFDYAPGDRGDFKRNEVATDYNAGFTGALARLHASFGGAPIPDSQFPPAAPAQLEYQVSMTRLAGDGRFVELRGVLQNMSTSPARVRSDLRFRYFMSLSEIYAAGLSAADVRVTSVFNQGSGFSALTPWGNPASRIYYVEFRFEGVPIYPGGRSEFRREVQFRIALPNTAAAVWSNDNDPSWNAGYVNGSGTYGTPAPRVPVYGGTVRLAGQEPGGGCGAGTGVNCPPVATARSYTTPVDVPVAVVLSGADSDGSIASVQIRRAPANGALSGTGQNRTYTPRAGFAGDDSFEFTVTDNAGGVSAPAIVSVRVQRPASNRAPTACFTVGTASPQVGQAVSFDARCSTDPDGDALTYRWSFGDGVGHGRQRQSQLCCRRQLRRASDRQRPGECAEQRDAHGRGDHPARGRKRPLYRVDCQRMGQRLHRARGRAQHGHDRNQRLAAGLVVRRRNARQQSLECDGLGQQPLQRSAGDLEPRHRARPAGRVRLQRQQGTSRYTGTGDCFEWQRLRLRGAQCGGRASPGRGGPGDAFEGRTRGRRVLCADGLGIAMPRAERAIRLHAGGSHIHALAPL